MAMAMTDALGRLVGHRYLRNGRRFCSWKCEHRTIKIQEDTDRPRKFRFLVGVADVQHIREHFVSTDAAPRDTHTLGTSDETNQENPHRQQDGRSNMPMDHNVFFVHPEDIIVEEINGCIDSGFVPMRTEWSSSHSAWGDDSNVIVGETFYCPMCLSHLSAATRAMAVSNSCSHLMCIPCAQRLLRNQVYDSNRKMDHVLVRAGKCSVCNTYGSWTHSITNQSLPDGHRIYGFHLRRFGSTTESQNEYFNGITDEDLWNEFCEYAALYYHASCREQKTRNGGGNIKKLKRYLRANGEIFFH
jgi:hypothetical protein